MPSSRLYGILHMCCWQRIAAVRHRHHRRSLDRPRPDIVCVTKWPVYSGECDASIVTNIRSMLAMMSFIQRTAATSFNRQGIAALVTTKVCPMNCLVRNGERARRPATIVRKQRRAVSARAVGARNRFVRRTLVDRRGMIPASVAQASACIPGLGWLKPVLPLSVPAYWAGYRTAL